MELTKANIDIGYVGQWEDPNTWQCTLQFFAFKEEAEKVKQQLLDDYEKARKWDELQDKQKCLNFEVYQELRERIEKRIKFRQNYEEPINPDKFCNDILIEELQKLLKDSKK